MSNAATPNRFDAQHAAAYEDRWAPLAPLRDSLHLQAGLVFHDLHADARVLCVGVGTGAELTALATRFPGWRFVACDPSVPMLDICRRRAEEGGFVSRCEFHACLVHELPGGPACDAATALLVSHFIVDRAQRLAFFREIAARLRPGGTLITADLCRATEEQHEQLLLVWRQMMYLTKATEEQVSAMFEAYKREVSLLAPPALCALLTEAGFDKPVLFSQSLLIHAIFAKVRGG